MWLLLAFLSAALLGFYDVFKKVSLRENAVYPVLFLNFLFCAGAFAPFIVVSAVWPDALAGTLLWVPRGDVTAHLFIALKACIVSASWLFGYLGMKHLPLTLVGPINATRPVLVLLGALLLFGERLNAWQWAGVTLAVVSFFLLSRSGRREGIDFRRNRWVACVVAAALLGAASGLYDKFLTARYAPMLVQSWYVVYQLLLMGPLMLVLWHARRPRVPLRWTWAILGISLFLCAADFVYFYALSLEGSLVSVVSMVRRGSVLVSFVAGAMVFREKNLGRKAVDLALVLLGMLCLYLGGH